MAVKRVPVRVNVAVALVTLGLAANARAARKAISKGQVRVGGEPFTQWDGSVELTKNTRFQMGDRSKTFELQPQKESPPVVSEDLFKPHVVVGISPGYGLGLRPGRQPRAR